MGNEKKRIVTIWHIRERSTDEWYSVFARSAAEASRILVRVHYDNMSQAEYAREYRVKISRVPDSEKMVVNCEENGQQTKTARAWCKGESPGMFCSSTYE